VPVPLVHIPGADLTGDAVRLSDDDIHHLTRVLRLRDGASVVVGDGQGGTRPAVIERTSARFSGASVHDPRQRPSIEVIQAVPKGRRMDEVVQVLVELGVERIRPVESERTVVRLEEAKRARAVERWRAVAAAAAAQSRRVWLPEVAAVTDPVTAFTQVTGAGLLLHPAAETPLGEVLAVDRPVGTPSVTVAVGPEGGWSDREVTAAHSAGMAAVSMGATVLRTEHAAVVACVVIAYAAGRFGGTAGTLGVT
jgi:16S rRNA (uracil1498-N3)-methyltransferase